MNRLATVLLLFCIPLVAAAQVQNVMIKINGVSKDIEKKLVTALAINKPRSDESGGIDQLQILHRRSIKQLNDALRSYGYYEGKVAGDLQAGDDAWIATYNIERGRRMQYGATTIMLEGEGRQEAELVKLMEKALALKGQPLDHARYEELKLSLLRSTVSLGYLDASYVKHEVRIDLERYQADLDLELDTGPLYRFGEITLKQDILDDHLLRKYLRIEQGERYSTNALLDLEQALYDTEYFKKVLVSPRKEQARDNTVPIDIELEARPPSRYTAGLGYYTDTGARGTLGWERRLINQYGHRFNVDLTASQITQNFIARYRIPVRDPRTDELVLFSEYLNDEPDTSASEIARIGTTLSTKWHNSRVDYSLIAQSEKFEVASDIGRARMVIPGIAISHVHARDRVYARKGFAIYASARGAADGVLSNVSFGQVYLRGKIIYSLWPRGRLLLRGEFGTTATPELQDLPASLRFFAGGDQSVRGYSYKSLGPRDENDDVIGGRHLLTGSVEYEHSITDKWAIAAFVDAGNAYNNLDEPLKQGAGIGLRWRSPVGPVRIDIASAISEPGRPWRLHVGIGPDL